MREFGFLVPSAGPVNVSPSNPIVNSALFQVSPNSSDISSSYFPAENTSVLEYGAVRELHDLNPALHE